MKRDKIDVGLLILCFFDKVASGEHWQPVADSIHLPMQAADNTDAVHKDVRAFQHSEVK